MGIWKIAAVQMDCLLGSPAKNLETIVGQLHLASDRGARLVIFPECAVSGYCFESKEEAWEFAQTLPGPASDQVGAVCKQLGVWAIFGLLEKAGGDLFNACALVGPGGLVATYRKIHLPFLGVDRFATPGNRPFAVHDLGGLRVGITICYDGSFPESARVLMLLGADLVVLPTNWPTGAATTVKYIIPARALENKIYYAAVNRIGEERGFQFIGQSRILNWTGDCLAESRSPQPEILCAELDPAQVRDKQIVKIPGKYELHRTAHRRPDMYGPITQGW